MLITVEEFLNSGMPVSTDISYEEVQQAIETVEEFHSKYRLGDHLYISLLEEPESEQNRVLLNGGTIGERHIAGMKQALFHGVFAFMLVDSIRLTRYASIEKDSEYSKNTSETDRVESARRHWEIYEAFVLEIQEVMNINSEHNNKNNLIFDSLLW